MTREIPPSKLEECVSFYGLLGFAPVPVPPGTGGRAVWLERTRSQIHLMPVNGAEPQRGHVGIIVERYDETLERLRDVGHAVDRRCAHWGSPRSYVRDPAGNLVELMAWGPKEGDRHED